MQKVIAIWRKVCYNIFDSLADFFLEKEVNYIMDYATNRKFFDLKHRKKVKILQNIGMPITFVGALLLAVSSIGGFGLFFLMFPAWILLIVGVPIAVVSASLRVKEADIMDTVETRRKEFKQDCEEILDYPGDYSTNALMLAGCEANKQTDTGLPTRKLKSGAILAPLVTFTHLYIKRDRVMVFTRRFSLVEEFQEDEKQEFLFSEFDNVSVATADNGDCKGMAFCLTRQAETVFTAPIFMEDYAIDSFAESILHTKERASKR